MKWILGLIIATFFVMSCNESYAQNYAIVVTKMQPKNKYYATEFGYRKITDSVIIYHERPEGRIFQKKEDIKISTEIGNLKFDSDRLIRITNKDKINLDVVYTPQNAITFNGAFIIKDKNDKMIAGPNSNYCYIDFEKDSDIFTTGDLINEMKLNQKNVKIMTIDGARIYVNGNEVTFKKNKYVLKLIFNQENEEAFCFVE